jgi:hypothetical protein
MRRYPAQPIAHGGFCDVQLLDVPENQNHATLFGGDLNAFSIASSNLA